jgi:hypothetical protein
MKYSKLDEIKNEDRKDKPNFLILDLKNNINDSHHFLGKND